MTRQKANNTTSIKQTKSKIPVYKKQGENNRWFDEYISIFTGKKEIINCDTIDRLTADLMNLAQTCDGIKDVSTYIKERKIPKNTYRDWLKKFPLLKEAHDELLQAIGNKREEEALMNKMNTIIAAKSFPYYLERYKDLEEWRSKLAAKDLVNASGSVTVITQGIPDTKIVPPLEVKVDE
jgi:hypothetical protein